MNRHERYRARSLRAAAAGVLLSVGLAAHATDFTLGFGAGADRGKTDCVDGFACDHSSAHGKLFLNYRLDEAWDLQALGFAGSRFKGGDTTDDGTTFGGSFRVDAL
ncbi:hypothetical protein, partial [Ideonella azotifigens]